MKENGLLITVSQYPKLLCTLYGQIHVDVISKNYWHKLQRKYSYGPFLGQVLFGQSTRPNLLNLYGVIYGV